MKQLKNVKLFAKTLLLHVKKKLFIKKPLFNDLLGNRIISKYSITIIGILAYQSH